MNKIQIDPNKTYTQSEYARLTGQTPQVIRYWVKTKKVKTISIQGTKLIIV